MTKQYFQHDYNARNSLQVKALISRFGASGYGIFWAIVEVLHEKKNKLPLKQYVYTGIADQLREKPEKVETVIKFCLEDCELFIEKNGFFGSTRVKRNIIKRLAISKVRAKSGKRGAIAQQKVAKERKLKESKEINKENWDSEKNNFSNDFRYKEKFAQDKKISIYQLEQKMKEFISDLELREDYKDLKELRNHFTNWFNLKTKNSNNKNSSEQEYSGAPALKRI